MHVERHDVAAEHPLRLPALENIAQFLQNRGVDVSNNV